MKITLGILVSLAFVGAASALCCPSNAIGMCADGTVGTPCCGYGPCNIFCCHCDGGCREPPASKRSKDLIAVDLLGAIDTNNDNNINLEESTKYIKPGLVKARHAERALFSSVDVDGDGLISPRDMDEGLSEEQLKIGNENAKMDSME